MLSIPYFQAEFGWSQFRVDLLQLHKALRIAILKNHQVGTYDDSA